MTPTQGLPIPPIVGQNVARLPDGSLDPAHFTDCGEACTSSAVRAQCGVALSPGCIRSALGLPEDNGSSTAENLAWFWHSLGGHKQVTSFEGSVLWDHLAHLRHYGQYVMLLGGWLDPTIGHWVLGWERGAKELHVMEPFNAQYAVYSEQFISDRGYGSQVWVS